MVSFGGPRRRRRKVIVSEFGSLHGVMEAPHRWHFPYWSDEMGEFKSDKLAAADTLLLGRTIYDGFAAAWPSAPEEEPDQMNGIRKHVVSTTLEEPKEWNNPVLLIKGDVADEVSGLKQQDGKDVLVCGSADLVRALMGHHLVDEYGLMVHPVGP